MHFSLLIDRTLNYASVMYVAIVNLDELPSPRMSFLHCTEKSVFSIDGIFKTITFYQEKTAINITHFQYLED